MRKIKQVFRNGFSKLPSYLIPLLVVPITVQKLYTSLISDWLFMKIISKGIFAVILGDTSMINNDDHTSSVKGTSSTMCPVLDLLDIIKDLVVNVVFKVWQEFFKPFKDCIKWLEEMINLFRKDKAIEIIPVALRMVLLAPAAVFCVLFVVFSVLSAFVTPFRRLHYLILITPLFLLYLLLMTTQDAIDNIMKSVPFIKVTLEAKKGYKLAEEAEVLLLAIILLTLVDYFFEPIITIRNKDQTREKYARFFDQELDDPICVN